MVLYMRKREDKTLSHKYDTIEKQRCPQEKNIVQRDIRYLVILHHTSKLSREVLEGSSPSNVQSFPGGALSQILDL